MGAIYSRALKVHVRLGEAPPMESDEWTESGSRSLIHDGRIVHAEEMLNYWRELFELDGPSAIPSNLHYGFIIGCHIFQNPF